MGLSCYILVVKVVAPSRLVKKDTQIVVGLVCGWECATVNVHDTAFHPLIQAFEEEMIVLADHGFYSKQADPNNLKVCQPKTWNARMIIETMFSMLTTVCHFKHSAHRVWDYFKARLAFSMAAYHIPIQCYGLKPVPHGFLNYHH